MGNMQSLWQDDNMRPISTANGAKKSKMTAKQRNAKITALMQTYFDRAAKGDYLPSDITLEEDLKKIFSTRAWGFREVTITIVMARLLDPSFHATEKFYDCHPRGVFEGPIRTVFLEYEIPHNLSGPLNVAKGVEKINDQWAAGRDPRDVADAVVRLAEKIDYMSPEELEKFAIHLHAYFLREQRASALLNIEVQPEADPDFLYKLCKQTINEVADAGNTPQRIIGYLLQAYHEELETGVIVSGHEDSAFTTNRTSKKVGDITEERINSTSLENNKITYTIYEVTVKTFDERRVIEAYSSIRIFDEENDIHTKEIIILCRKRDIHSDVIATTDASGYFGKLEYRDLIFYYQDIYEWIMAQLLRMTPKARIDFYAKLDDYIQRPNTPQKVRAYWKHLHEKTSGR